MSAILEAPKRRGKWQWKNRLTVLERFDDFVFPEPNSGCWLWDGSRDPNGYGQMRIGHTPGKLFRASRIAWELFAGPIPDGLWVLHKCDNPACVNPAHLFLGTPKNNTDDAIKKGRFDAAGLAIGRFPRPMPHNRRLTDDDVRAIRATPVGTKGLAAKYGITKQAIVSIRRRKSYQEVA